jgi:hypothetical protein
MRLHPFDVGGWPQLQESRAEEQLATIRQIYPPEQEALGVVIDIELVDSPRTI